MCSLRAAAAVWLFAGMLIGPACRLGYDEVPDAGADGDASMDATVPDRDAMVDRDAMTDMDAMIDRDAMISMDAMPPDEAGQDAGPDAEVGFLASTASLARAFEQNYIVADGALFSWGREQNGQLGQGPPIDPLNPMHAYAPRQITTPAQSWLAVCGGQAHACALSAAGEIYCWGSNGLGRLGVPPATVSSDTPLRIDVITGLTEPDGFTQISCQGNFTCALRPDVETEPEIGLVYCWGDNDEGSLGVEQPGDLEVPYRSEPTPINLIDTSLRFKSVSAGDGHACALTVDGELYCWGRNSQAQMGDDPSFPASMVYRYRSPTRIGSATWLAVSAGLKVTCGVQTDQRLYCWGGIDTDPVGEGAENGEVGNGVVIGGVPVPTEIGSGSLGGATRTWRTVVTSVRTHECALTTEDELYCWGLGENGQLGDGQTGDGYSNAIPTLVESEDGVNDQWEQIGTGGTYTCALRKDHSLWCWGKNEFGTLGQGLPALVQASRPTRVIVPEPQTP